MRPARARELRATNTYARACGAAVRARCGRTGSPETAKALNGRTLGGRGVEPSCTPFRSTRMVSSTVAPANVSHETAVFLTPTRTRSKESSVAPGSAVSLSARLSVHRSNQRAGAQRDMCHDRRGDRTTSRASRRCSMAARRKRSEEPGGDEGCRRAQQGG